MFKLPIEDASLPIDPKKMKKFLIKFDYEVIEDSAKSAGELQPRSERSAVPKSMIINNPPAGGTMRSIAGSEGNSKKFNVFVDRVTKVKIKSSVTTKLAIVYLDDIFTNDNGELCSFTGMGGGGESHSESLTGIE